MTKTKSQVIKIGDRVKVIEPTFVERIGYPLTCQMVWQEVNDNPKINEAMKFLGLTTHWKARNAFVHGVCQALVNTRGFGGKERSLHTFELWQLENVVCVVEGKRVVKTGTYYPASDGSSTEYGDEWYEPGGLENCKTHVLLKIDGYWIQQCNIIKEN